MRSVCAVTRSPRMFAGMGNDVGEKTKAELGVGGIFFGKMKNSELSCCMQDARLFQAENKPKVQK